jgi:putative FmdB family regulatory protein
MPLYEYQCPICATRTEAVRPYTRRDASPICPGCRSYDLAMDRLVSAPAFTPSSWGDSKWAGRFDKGLGVTLKDKNHRERIMKARGLVEDTAYDQQNRLDTSMSAHGDHERTVKRYEHNLREAGGDKGLAIATTFPQE